MRRRTWVDVLDSEQKLLVFEQILHDGLELLVPEWGMSANLYTRETYSGPFSTTSDALT